MRRSGLIVCHLLASLMKLITRSYNTTLQVVMYNTHKLHGKSTNRLIILRQMLELINLHLGSFQFKLPPLIYQFDRLYLHTF